MIYLKPRSEPPTRWQRLLSLTVLLFTLQRVSAEAPLTLPPIARGNSPGTLDLSFDPTRRGRAPGLTGGAPAVHAVLAQPDGKVLVGGWFNGVNDRLRNSLVRVNADGSVDRDFKPGYGPNGTVTDLALQSDGRCILIGDFSAVNGTAQPLIARLTRTGQLDRSFQCQVAGDANLRLSGVAVGQDGKIWIGGQFTNVNGIARRNLARLNSDGSLDATFDPGILSLGTNQYVEGLELQSDGKLLVAGVWTGSSRSLLRLNADGSLDDTFVSVSIFHDLSGQIRDIACNSNGTIAIVGYFTLVNGQPRAHVARLTANGEVDAGFNPGPGPDYNFLWTVAVEPDGKVVVGGNFQAFSGAPRIGIARLTETGAVDPQFDPGNAAGLAEGYYPLIRALSLDAGGKVLVGAEAWWESDTTNALLRLSAAGQRDPGFETSMTAPIESARPMVLQPNGKIITGIHGAPGTTLLRLNSHGVPDRAFVPGTNIPVVHALAMQKDGKLLVGTTLQGEPQTGVLLRLRPNGAVDGTFHAPLMQAGEIPIETLAVQPDGRILVGGLIWNAGGHPHQGIIRLLPDGQFDDTFQPVPITVTDDPGYGVEHVFLTRGGKILIAGGFRWSSGDGAGIALLNPDGTVDETFSNNVERVTYISSAAMQLDGKFILSGVSGTFEGAFGIIRINADGTRDNSFHPAIPGEASALAVRRDGRILVAPGVNGSSMVRLNRNGSLAPFRGPPLGQWSVHSILLQRDSRIVIGGGFHSIDGIPMHGIARLRDRR